MCFTLNDSGHVTMFTPFFPHTKRRSNIYYITGADPEFSVRGGSTENNGAERSEGEKFWGISCEKSRF